MLVMEKEATEPEQSPTRDLVLSAYLYNLGFLRLAIIGNYESAVDLLLQARDLRASVLGDVHTLTIQAVVSRGWALALTGNTKTSVDELNR